MAYPHAMAKRRYLLKHNAFWLLIRDGLLCWAGLLIGDGLLHLLLLQLRVYGEVEDGVALRRGGFEEIKGWEQEFGFPGVYNGYQFRA